MNVLYKLNPKPTEVTDSNLLFGKEKHEINVVSDVVQEHDLVEKIAIYKLPFLK
jgi:hypothetical protein